MIRITLSLLLIFCCFNSYGSLSDYRLAAGDTVTIHVYGQPDLTVTTKLDKSGVVKYPFVGEVMLVDKTTTQVSEYITNALKQGYLVSPDVHVFVSEYRPFYIHGQVRKPGGFAYQPGLILSKAIALAGGLTERASNRWLLKRQSIKGKEIIEAQEDTEIMPGDIITVEQSFF
ncbi:polysaccharide biosynthesis/export family protein [Catenovulum sediminis]|uniref:Polysaccharide biosynthesis/export family protein n=1 Tax=Catenovulum sediminis TaxID=1740262 RepID=A0ABV1RK05_9ALTE|nr:polysaccharide biosynthesis/export family protein [Catenovulum sediminis]